MRVEFYPSDTGRIVLSLDARGESHLAKVAVTTAQASTLRTEVAQSQYLSEIGIRSVSYAPSRLLCGHVLTRRFIKGTPLRAREARATLDDVTNLSERFAAALDELRTLGHAPVISHDFVPQFLKLRAERALRTAERIGDAPMVELASAVAVNRFKTLLTLSLHGDLTCENVILDVDERVWFIDTRATLIRGVPMWDPLCDYATLIAVECLARPSRELPDYIRAILRCVAAWADEESYEGPLRSHVTARLLGLYGNHFVSTDQTRHSQAVYARESLLNPAWLGYIGKGGGITA
jgi:hypothetical protein